MAVSDPRITDPLIDRMPSFTGVRPPDHDNRLVGADYDLDRLVASLHPLATAPTLGLTKKERTEARRVVLRGARISLDHKDEIHYSEASDRWGWHSPLLRAMHWNFILRTDCSGWFTWLYDDNLQWVIRKYGLPDFVNGLDWDGGWTGSSILHGVPVDVDDDLAADAIFYGPGPSGSHMAIATGDGRVVSNGSEGGPYLEPIHYRPDFLARRRLIR